jgi:Ca2+-binding EF-hand superfamily protein
MKNIYRFFLATIIGTALVGLALAQEAKKKAEAFRELFLELDVNRDGAIEREEVPESARAAFDRLLKRGDDNRNGRLEAAEYKAVLVELRTFNEQAKKKAIERFKAMDKDGDGKVSREEFTGPKPRFDVLDRDGDGYVTEQEFLAATPAKAAAKVKVLAKKKAASIKNGD